MFRYAQADTHYLLYIYDRMRNELLESSDPSTHKMILVLERSSITSLNEYKKERYDAENGLGGSGWANLLKKFQWGSKLTK